MKTYLNKTIEDWGGETSPDYKTFERKYRNCLKKIASGIGAELVKFNGNHYNFSCFFKKGDKFAYMSISDVRHWKNEWYNNILVRTAKSERDFTGGYNQYCSYDKLGDKLSSLLR